MPVILTCSHGGTQAPPGVEELIEGETPAGLQFTRERDLETAEITEATAPLSIPFKWSSQTRVVWMTINDYSRSKI
jgi:hypothetical protein